MYGLVLAVAGALLTLALFFLGFHSDPAKLAAAKWIGALCAIVIGIAVTALGVKARRSEVPEAEGFGYGRALGAGVMISLVAAFLGAVFNYVYVAYINTEYAEVMLQDQMDKLQAKGLSGAQLDQAEKMTQFFMTPPAIAIFGLIFGFIFGVLISLVLAAFLKRPAPAAPAKA